MTLLLIVPINSSMHFLTLLMRGMAQTGAKLLLILSQVKVPKFLIPIKAGGYLVASCYSWLGYWCCFFVIFLPYWSHLVQDPRVLQHP